MLPITNHRSVHVPHSLATLAAIVALILALGWASVDDSDRAMATSPSGTDIELGATGGDERDELGAAARDERDAFRAAGRDERDGFGAAGRDERDAADRPDRRADVDGGGVSGLLPLVLPGFTGR